MPVTVRPDTVPEYSGGGDGEKVPGGIMWGGALGEEAVLMDLGVAGDHDAVQ